MHDDRCYTAPTNTSPHRAHGDCAVEQNASPKLRVQADKIKRPEHPEACGRTNFKDKVAQRKLDAAGHGLCQAKQTCCGQVFVFLMIVPENQRPKPTVARAVDKTGILREKATRLDSASHSHFVWPISPQPKAVKE